VNEATAESWRAKREGRVHVNWVEAAERVLREIGCPLTSIEIAHEPIRLGYKRSSETTPKYGVQAAIARDLREGWREASPFVVLGEGNEVRKYGLK
jgi:hypothetical protein